MSNPSDFLYDLRIVSLHPTDPGPISYAMSRATGIPTAVCRQFVNGDRRSDFFIRGVTFTFARSIKILVSEAGGEAEMSECPWSRGYPWSKAFN
jgi:hypothetical protein